ncbi:MAG TPA: hypothetical protein VKV33_11510, partial [Streptosporangiaceae bacterium]|nr:hypothetical protein [Streptosporangiaceae bacterium]
ATGTARTATGTARTATGTARTATASAVQPNPAGELDCNGLSRIQKPVKPAVMCIDPRGNWNGRFYENGKYIGHDEPSVRFISSQPGSAAQMSYTERLPVEPSALPTVRRPGHDVTHTFELTIAPWFSMTVCDPDSTPMLPCTPESDANAPNGSYPGAGAAFVELQFYPPGFAPFADNISCDNTHWCSALTIDSLECSGSGNNIGTCNNNCTEPVNFAFLQTDGVPTGPPSPQLSDLATYTPNGHTLLMKPGDTITASLSDVRVPGGRALEARETDLSTGQTGYMIASAADGFMNTDPATCDGTPFNFQPEYSSAAPQNIVPWGPGPYEINDEFEVGHFEPCTSVTGPATESLGSVSDTYYTNCEGPYETSAENPNLEPDDAPCYPFGDTHGGTAAPNLVTGCDVFTDAIGDLDYDGTPYYPDWPDSVRPDSFPSTFLQLEPRTAGGWGYPKIQFMTDNSATQLETGCDTVTGANCVLPPPGPGHFYPYWTQARVAGACVWEFGNVRNGNTFGGDAQYGSVGPGTLGAFAGPIRPNPRC